MDWLLKFDWIRWSNTPLPTDAGVKNCAAVKGCDKTISWAVALIKTNRKRNNMCAFSFKLF
jgi:hypothetical protein